MDHTSLPLLKDIGLCIVFASFASHVARSFKQPLILGYVLGGILLSQHFGLGWVTDETSIELISEIGLIFLLFIIGLEINLRELIRMGKTMFTIGILQFSGCVLLAMGTFHFLGLSIGNGKFDLLYLGIALGLSSTMIVVKLLHDKFELHTRSGQLTIGILVLQDVWAIIFMAFQPNLLNPNFSQILQSLSFGIALVIFSFLASRYLLKEIFRRATKNPELILITAIAWCFFISGLAEKAHLSKEMGALIAGMCIAAFPYGTDVISKLTGIRDFFVTLFFVSLGLKVPLPSFSTVLVSIGITLFILLTRFISIIPPAYFLKQGIRNGLVTAINTSQISEFSLVILALGIGHGHISQELQSTILTSMIVASVFSTYLILFNHQIAQKIIRLISKLGLTEITSPETAKKKIRRDILLLGYFRVGEATLKIIEEKCPELRDRILVVDFDASLDQKLKERKWLWSYGDLAHPDTLRHIGIEDASVIICSISDIFLKGTNNNRLLTHLKKMAPQAQLVMTAETEQEADKLLNNGAHHVIIPSALAGEKIFETMEKIDVIGEYFAEQKSRGKSPSDYAF